MKTSVTVMVGSASVFAAIYVVAYKWCVGGWIVGRKKARHEAASCFMSLLHGTLATLLTALNVAVQMKELEQPWQQLLRAQNTAFQAAVMEFSIAYFVVDLLHYALFVPEELLFILHHVATSTYMLSCRYYTGHGAFSVMCLLGLAESTSFLQNLWTLSSLAGATEILGFLTPPFLVFYTFARGVLGPLLTWNLCMFYFSGQADTVIPRWLAFYWMSTATLAITGSLFWASGLWASWLLKLNQPRPVKKLE